MPFTNRFTLADQLHDVIRPIHSVDDLIAPVLDLIGDARIVLIGEASHGTDDFYRYRAEITKRLIKDKGFTGVCAEADWPDAWRVNRFVRGFADDTNAAEALAGFKRFPQWMWRNTVVLDFINWLRERNDKCGKDECKCGFYGIDLYSLNGSIRAVLEYLDKVDHAAATRARYRYSCFEDFGEDPQRYGYAASFDLGRNCQDEVIAQLTEMQQRRGDYVKHDGRVAEDELFFAEQNARLVQDAERYYRMMFDEKISSWNVRDEHMTDTIDALMSYLDGRNRTVGGTVPGGKTKLVVWAHNSHLGDATATEMGEQGETNVGALVGERWGDEACNIGFSTYTGTVTAATDWDGPAETKRVRPALPASYEELFHNVGGDFLLRMKDLTPDLRTRLCNPLLQRAIGVIYRPDTERISHYFHARLPEQFDAMIHLDETTALIPLDRKPIPEARALEETYPTGL
jgi:erythromycin esterase-like protein